MQNYKSFGARIKMAVIRFIPAALSILILSGCAGMNSNGRPAAPLHSANQVSIPKPLPMPEPGPQPATLAPTGSIWGAGSGSLYADLRAAKVGDVVTITVSETSAASKASATTAQKAKTFTGSFTFGGLA